MCAPTVGCVLDLLLPQRCLGCSPPRRAALRRLPVRCCRGCARRSAPAAALRPRWPVARCRECAGRRLAFASARAAVAYDGAARRLAASWKERGLRRLAAARRGARGGGGARPAAVGAHVRPARRRPQPAARPPSAPPSSPASSASAGSCRCWRHWRGTRPLARQRGLGLAERRRNVAARSRLVTGAPAAGRARRRRLHDRRDRRGGGERLRRAGARRVEVVTFARAIRYPQR